jgi:3-deoxy-7-phosphoheptulonate synthase
LTVAERKIRAAGLAQSIMVDCSHANSDKQYERQETVLKSVIRQKAKGRDSLIGLMLESHLLPGSQPIPGDPGKMRYGVSVTDACIGWEKTEELLGYAYRLMGDID